MTPDALRELIQRLHELVCWLEDERPGSLDANLASSLMAACKEELLKLVREGAK